MHVGVTPEKAAIHLGGLGSRGDCGPEDENDSELSHDRLPTTGMPS